MTHQRNERERLEPANGIIMDLGGYDAVAGRLGKSLHTIYRWAWSHEYKGCGGYIPRWHHNNLIAWANEQGWILPRERFSHPGDIALPRRLKKRRISVPSQEFRQAS